MEKMNKDIFNKNNSLTVLVDIAKELTLCYTDVNKLFKESFDSLEYQRQIETKVRDTCHTRPFRIIRREIEINGLLSKFFAAHTFMFVDSDGQLVYCSYEAYKEMMKNANIPILNEAEYFEIVSYIKTTYYYGVEKQKAKDEEDD